MKVRVSILTAAGIAVLAVGDIGLLSIIWNSLAQGDSVAVENVSRSFALNAPPGEIPAKQPILSYKETMAHPIFFKSRAPYIPPPPPPPPVQKVAAPPPPVDPGFVLGGVMIVKDRKRAYIFTKANPNGSWASEGDEFIGWRVIAVNAMGATLRQQDRTIELQLYPKNAQ